MFVTIACSDTQSKSNRGEHRPTGIFTATVFNVGSFVCVFPFSTVIPKGERR